MIWPRWPAPWWTCFLRGAAPAATGAGARRPACARSRGRGRHGEDDPRTLCDIFYHSVETFRKPDHLRSEADGAWRDDQLRRVPSARSRSCPWACARLGVEKGDRVAILSENRPEWAYADLRRPAPGAVDVAHLPDPARPPRCSTS